MLGAIIGDIVGSRWEFNPTKDYNFELFSDKNSFTDDTICTVAVADALLHGSDDYGRFIHDWCSRYPHPMGGYGGRFAQWVMSDNPHPYGSYGNGSAMRVSPIGMWFEDEGMICSEARKTAECTHNHPEGIKGAEATAVATFLARAGKSMEEIRETVVRDYYPLGFTLDEIRPTYEFDVSCQGSVPQALEAFFESTSFEDAIRNAISIGGDSDTIGAICGAVAGAFYGVPDGIRAKSEAFLPQHLLDVLHDFERMYC